MGEHWATRQPGSPPDPYGHRNEKIVRTLRNEKRRTGGSRYRWIGAVILAMLCSFAIPPGSSYGIGHNQDARIKATFLLNFSKLATWPDRERHSSGFQIAVSGDPYLWQTARSDLAGKRVDGRRVSVVSLDFEEAMSPSPDTRVLYVSGYDEEQLRTLVAALAGRPILLIGDRPGFCDLGGCIGLLHEDDSIRFEINRSQELRSGIRIDPRLLRLAHRVIE